jgi:hypothetical protein
MEKTDVKSEEFRRRFKQRLLSKGLTKEQAIAEHEAFVETYDADGELIPEYEADEMLSYWSE